jgi:hypothetical protein
MPPAPAQIPGMARPQLRKITLGEMRAARGHNVSVYCPDIVCNHSVNFNADPLPDDVSLSDLEPRLRCSRCGRKGVDVRPIYWTQDPIDAKPWPARAVLR